MELIKVRDNQNRPVNGFDIIMGAVFGNKVPREFIPGEYYQIGEHVYKFDPLGNLIIYKCTKDGIFYNCTDPEFTVWSLDTIIEKYNEAVNDIKDVFINNKTGDLVLYDFKSLSSTCTYKESDDKVKIKADLSDIDVSKYMSRYNTFDVFLKHGKTDNYVLPTEYSFEGSDIIIETDLKSSTLPLEFTSNYYPEGRRTFTAYAIQTIKAEEYPELELQAKMSDGTTKFFKVVAYYEYNPYYWYSENGELRTFEFTEDGINVIDYDVLKEIGKESMFGYKICNLKIEGIHTIVDSPINELQNTKVFRLDDFSINGNHDPIGSELDKHNQSITIPIVIEPTRNLVDELYVTLDYDKQLLNMTSKNGYIKQVKFSFTAKKIAPDFVYVVGGSARSDMTRYLRDANEIGKIVEINGQKYIEFPEFDLFKYNSFDFELYVNRVFVSNYERYMDETGKLYIKLLDEEYIDYDNNEFLFHIYYSISQGIGLTKTSDEHIVVDDKDAFRIFLTREFINKYQWLRLHNTYRNIPPEVSVGSKSTANISDPNYYLSFGETLKSDVFTMFFQDIKRLNGSMKDGCNSESYPVMEVTRNLNVPFANYNADNDDFLIFKTGGVLLNSSKWYLNGNQVNLYIHENPMSRGDYVDFRLLDRDNNIRVYNKFITATEEDQDIIILDDDLDDKKITFFMIFTMSGEFISTSKYSRLGNKIIFDKGARQAVEIHIGTRFEIVYGEYTGEFCKTLYHSIRIPSTSDNQKEFIIDEEVDFNMDTNNLLIFREDGMYVGEKFYHIDRESNKIIIDKGTGVINGSHIDVIVIRNLSFEVPVGTK